MCPFEHFFNKIEQSIREILNNRNSVSGVENMGGKVITTPCSAPMDTIIGMSSWSKDEPLRDETIYRI